MDIGSTLREARMRARIDITEVEVATKIRAKYLRALENEEWDLLPGPIYTKTFLRTYGNYLGLDSRMLTDEFKRRYERPADHDQNSIGSLRRDRERRGRRSRVPSWVPVVAVAAILVGILYAVGSATNNGSTSPSARVPATPRHHRHHHHRRHPVSLPAASVRRRRVTLRLMPTATVYVCLVNAAGRKLINEQNFAPGQAVPLERGRRLLLTLGNAQVQVRVNGRAVSVTPSPNAIRLLITAAGVSHIPLSQTPTCP